MDPPRIKLLWIRGKQKINFTRPDSFLALGLRGSGKSSLLESLAMRYPKVIDLFGSKDSEGLAFCRSPLKDDILFVSGDSVEIKSRWPNIQISKLTMKDIQTYRVILSVSAFYGSMDEEFHGLNELIKILWKRSHWREPWYLMIREASNFIYSRIRIVKNQTIAKADFIHVLREARHMGYAIGVDTIRWTSIDKEIRDVSDYIFIKRVGVFGLPQDLRWLYRYIDPIDLMNCSPAIFILVSNKGPVAAGKFEEIPWHKKEKEDLLAELDIYPQYGELPDYLLKGEGHNRVTSAEHTEILEKYLEIRNMGKVGQALGRSPGTVHTHIANHNREVRSFGHCSRCSKVGHELASEVIEYT